MPRRTVWRMSWPRTRSTAVLNKGQNVFNCFHSASTKANPVFPVPSGTPAPH